MLAALVQHLASGSRKADGSPNASGRAWFYDPGTNSATAVYGDADATVQLSQPVTLSAAGKAEVYVKNTVRLLTEYVVSTGVYATLDDFDVLTGSAPSVGVRNAGFTGVDVNTGSSVAGGDTTIDAVLSSFFASTGGIDGKYKESSGATARLIKSKFSETSISVKDFGAVGNGIADDTSAIQATINRVAALGGGLVYFPPGTYLISAALTLSSKNGVSFIGAGYYVSQIKQTVAATNVFTVSSCNGMRIFGLNLFASSANTGVAISLTDCTNITLDAVGVDYNIAGSFDTCVLSTGTSAHILVNACTLNSNNAAGARCIKLSGGITSNFRALNSALFGHGTSLPIEITDQSSRVVIANCFFSGGTSGVSISAAANGIDFVIYGCPSLGNGTYATNGISIGTATDLRLRQWANQNDGYAIGISSGSAHTPDRSRGSEIRLIANSGGAGIVTINAPTPAPLTTTRDMSLVFRLASALGGNATYRFNAVFLIVGGGTDIVVADTTTTTVVFRWDGDTSKWRESTTRANTAT